jgi:hypothetical protein
MSSVYRSMLKEGNHPLVAARKKALGVVIPGGDARPDVHPDKEDRVEPGGGGMSVYSDWQKLPYYRIPKRLKGVVADAAGQDDLYIWKLREVPFVAGPLNSRLRICCEDEEHGLVEPNFRMLIDDFQDALAGTRLDWVIEEA